MGLSVLQPWVTDLTLMQQSVLLTSLRAPDGIAKNHPVKVLMRWLRRCVLLSAFDRSVLVAAYAPGGGSFTGPLPMNQSIADYHSRYLECVDELPHHFQLHFMHAIEILGYKHPTDWIRAEWNTFYKKIVNDAHLLPESEETMDHRLGDKESQWRAAEEVVAK